MQRNVMIHGYETESQDKVLLLEKKGSQGLDITMPLDMSQKKTSD